jgi:hypothetical protein
MPATKRHYVDFAVFWNATPESRKAFMASLDAQGFELCITSNVSPRQFNREVQKDTDEYRDFGGH